MWDFNLLLLDELVAVQLEKILGLLLLLGVHRRWGVHLVGRRGALVVSPSLILLLLVPLTLLH